MNDAPPALDGERNAREQLIEAASQIMRDGDTVDLSLSELSLRSGLNSALVKYYFGNKQGLMLALLERDMRNIVNSLDALLAKDFAPDEKLRVHIRAAIGTYFRFPYLNRLLMRLVRDASPDVSRKIADDYLRPISLAYTRLIDEGVQKGLFRPIDPQLFYFTVTGAADRFFSARLVLHHCYGQSEMTEQMRDDYADHTLDILMPGLLRHPKAT
ncbi:TetR family transcriptional regulator [Blastomonas sp.]|uniref:TetR family transcriptional regulator n=1 Tax=Blastomonas sp. TaxID=1909299 RepID=UPI00262EBF3B|nr:TetR family transcriptional regulator [Blastomonas sp.]MDM7956231.1 TetR family transcriptional regulator [Blastomonas sp.]